MCKNYTSPSGIMAGQRFFFFLYFSIFWVFFFIYFYFLWFEIYCFLWIGQLGHLERLNYLIFVLFLPLFCSFSNYEVIVIFLVKQWLIFCSRKGYAIIRKQKQPYNTHCYKLLTLKFFFLLLSTTIGINLDVHKKQNWEKNKSCITILIYSSSYCL